MYRYAYIYIVYIYIICKHVYPSHPIPSLLRIQGFDVMDPMFLFVGRLAVQKGPDLLLEALGLGLVG